MLSLDMLDVVIGIIFIYLLLSLICSAINELVESKLKLRAVDLEQGIRELLNDPSGKGLVKDFYNHPLIYSLFRGRYDPQEIRLKKNLKKQRYSRGSDLPSYIPSKNFALALMDIIKPTQKVSEEAAANPVQSLSNSVEAIANSAVKKALLTIIDSAGNDITKAREGIENWYNSAMDRVSGWYKRRVQIIIFVMGFFASVIVNADSFAIFNNLANDRPLRNSLVVQAQLYKDKIPDTVSTPIDKLKKNVNALLELGLPIGWGWKSLLNNNSNAVTNLHAIPAFDVRNAFWSSIWQWLLKVIGWTITGLAISLGAPFWFDTLNKVMVVRSTVKPTEKSLNEASEDRQKN